MRSATDSVQLDRNLGIVKYKKKTAILKSGKSLYTSLYKTPQGNIFILEVNPMGYVSGQVIDKDTMETIGNFFDQNPDDLFYNGEKLKKSFYDYNESRQADIVCDNMTKCRRGDF